MRLQRHFDMVARYYDRLIGGVDDEGDLAGLLDPAFAGDTGAGASKGQAWVIDVGGGTGRVAQRLAASERRVLICDRSLPMARQAQGKGLAAVQASADRLPFASHSAAAIIAVDAFHHFTYPAAGATQEQAAAEMGRVLRRGGRAVIQEPDTRWTAVRLIELGEKLLLMRSRFLTPRRLAELFEATGLRSVEIREAGLSAQVVLERLT